MWTCGTALWGMKNCTLEMAYILVEGLSGAVASGLGKVRYLN